MVKITKKSADNCTAPEKKKTNKGVIIPDSINKENLIYPDSLNRYYLTKPIIDKISILGTPNITDEDKAALHKTFDAIELGEKDFGFQTTVKSLFQPNKGGQSRFKYHYKLSCWEGGPEFDFLFGPTNDENRFLKIEFSPWKLGHAGVREVVNWYNGIIVHDTFDSLFCKPDAIQQVDIAVDVIGIHISDMMLNIETGVKSSTWHGYQGRIETYYPKTKQNNTSLIKVYNKVKEEAEKGDGKAQNHYKAFADLGIPVTRYEYTREFKKGKSIEALPNTSNPFASKHVYWIPPLKTVVSTKQDLEQINTLWPLFLDSVRYRGKNAALKRLPEKWREDFEQRLNKKVNLLAPYNDSEDWKGWWSQSVQKTFLDI